MNDTVMLSVAESHRPSASRPGFHRGSDRPRSLAEILEVLAIAIRENKEVAGAVANRRHFVITVDCERVIVNVDCIDGERN